MLRFVLKQLIQLRDRFPNLGQQKGNHGKVKAFLGLINTWDLLMPGWLGLSGGPETLENRKVSFPC
jgi:hypothetical protein